MAKETKTVINLVEGKIFEVTETGKYLLIVPEIAVNSSLNEALIEFFGSSKVLAIGVKDVNDVKIAALLEENAK